MLQMDLAVALALLLSLASALLCVAYGWSQWNADADDDVMPAGERSLSSGGSDDDSSQGYGS